MAAGIYPPEPGFRNAAGQEIGPCVGPCAHTDCASMRADAERICPPCGEPIGYGNRVYFLDGGEGATVIVHAVCREKQVEADLEAARREVERS